MGTLRRGNSPNGPCSRGTLSCPTGPRTMGGSSPSLTSPTSSSSTSLVEPSQFRWRYTSMLQWILGCNSEEEKRKLCNKKDQRCKRICLCVRELLKNSSQCTLYESVRHVCQTPSHKLRDV